MTRYLLSLLLATYTTFAFGIESHTANFAFGGATTHSRNATALFAPELDDAAGAVGLELVGLHQQLDFAEATIRQVNAEQDVFWLWAGANNILIGALTGTPDPTQAPTDIMTAMKRLYHNLGARQFIIPNLMLMGNLPQFNTDPNTQNGINALTIQQNAILAQTLEQFRAEHPDASVTLLDVQSLFLQLETSGEFLNTTEACFTTGLPNGIPCNHYLYADDIHFTSSAATKIVDLALRELPQTEFRKLIVLGDSFSDTGSFFNTIERAIGTGFPGFPFHQGRFSDGPNVIDQLEARLQPDTMSGAFHQPMRTNIAEGINPIDANVIVPANLTLSSESRFGMVALKFPGKGLCLYLPDWQPDGFRRLSFCSGGLQAGQSVSTEYIVLRAPFSTNSVSTDLFHY